MEKKKEAIRKELKKVQTDFDVMKVKLDDLLAEKEEIDQLSRDVTNEIEHLDEETEVKDHTEQNEKVMFKYTISKKPQNNFSAEDDRNIN